VQSQTQTETVFINDHPISMRDQMTRRSALVYVEQQTGTSIVVKGRYYPPGAVRDAVNPPLHLLITPQPHLGTVRAAATTDQPSTREVPTVYFHLKQFIIAGQASPAPRRFSRRAPHQRCIERGGNTSESCATLPSTRRHNATPRSAVQESTSRSNAEHAAAVSQRPSSTVHASAALPSTTTNPVHAATRHASSATTAAPHLQHAPCSSSSIRGPSHNQPLLQRC
jgi:hypothetical protein